MSQPKSNVFYPGPTLNKLKTLIYVHKYTFTFCLTPCPLWWPNVTRLFYVLWSEFPQRETFCWLALPWSWPRQPRWWQAAFSQNHTIKWTIVIFLKPMKVWLKHYSYSYTFNGSVYKVIFLCAASWLQCSLFLSAWTLVTWWRTQTRLSLNQGGQGGGETLLLCQSRLTKYVDKFSQFWRVRVWAIQNVCWTFRAGLAVYLRVMWRIPETKLLHKNLRFFVFC